MSPARVRASRACSSAATVVTGGVGGAVTNTIVQQFDICVKGLLVPRARRATIHGSHDLDLAPDQAATRQEPRRQTAVARPVRRHAHGPAHTAGPALDLADGG